MASALAPAAVEEDAEARCWTDLPLPCWRLLMSHLAARRTLFNCSVACKAFVRVADELATDLRRVEARDVSRALLRFDRAASLSIELPPAPVALGPVSVISGGGGGLGAGDPFEALGRAVTFDRAAAALKAALANAPLPAAARIQRLRVAGYPDPAAALAAAAGGGGGAGGESSGGGAAGGAAAEASGGAAGGASNGGRWSRVASLELEEEDALNWPALASAAAALPALRRLRVAGAGYGRPAAPGSELSPQLEELELADFGPHAAEALAAGLPALPSLRRLVVERMPELESLNLAGLQGLEELVITDAPVLYALPGLSQLTRLTSLTLHACPNAVRRPPAPAPGLPPPPTPASSLGALRALRSLRLTGADTLHRLSSGVSELTALTNLELDIRLRDRGPEGNEPEDFAPLGRGVPAAAGIAGSLRCPGLRRLVARGFRGPLHLPEGLERFVELEELDIGGRQELWNLGPWLLRMPSLRRLVVPRRSAQQSVFEALALRNDPHQVDVVEESGDDGCGEASDDYGCEWDNEDAEGWADEGL